MVLTVGVVSIAAAILVSVAAAARARAESVAERDAVRFLGGDGFVRVRRQHTAAGARILAAVAANLTPRGATESLRDRIERAGGGRSVEQVMVAKAAGGIGGAVLGVLTTASRPAAGLFVLAVSAPLGFFAPDAMLRRRADARAEAIRAALPDSLDLMAIMVEAGVGLEGAIARAAEDAGGPLGDEYRRMLHEMSLGSSRREAFSALRSRVNCPELSRFVLAMLQADRLGIAVGSVLRTQAIEMRVRRRQRAKERAAKTPVKILFPLVFGIFPALLVIILGPAALRIMQTVFTG